MGKDEAYFKTETVAEGGETYRIWYIGDAEKDAPAIKTLTENRIKGLLQMTYREGELKFCITGMKSLYEYIRENNSPEGKQRLLKMFSGMLKTALILDAYMLSADRLVLNPMEIYVDEGKSEAVMPYIPIKGKEKKDSRQFLLEIGKLCATLLEGIDGEPIERSTGISDNRQENAEGIPQPGEGTDEPAKEERIPCIIRKRTGEKVLINRDRFRLGKDASRVDYHVKDNPAVSRNHADIVRKPDGFYLTDKGSLNHTFVDGRKLGADEYRKLENGCLIQLADEVFEFIAEWQ